MVINNQSRCIKMLLPNNKVVDILTSVLDELFKWKQNTPEAPESGGYLVGYQHTNTGNITIESASHPYEEDKGNQIRFFIRDIRHKLFLSKAERNRSYYMGVWHTHPQAIPVPSNIDWDDWEKTLQSDKTGCSYAFFIIVGTKELRVWVGDFVSGNIVEIFEAPKDECGIYTNY